jgi:flagellar motor switch protein FliG
MACRGELRDMGLSGKRKAAMLLTTLDTATAAELLKGQPPEVVQDIAMELSQLDATGQNDPEKAIEVTKEFCGSLQKARAGDMHVKTFVTQMLKGTAGKEDPAQLHLKMKQAIREKDPFIAITSASPIQIAAALANETPQATALVLSSLSPKLSTQVLARFDEETSAKVIWKMTQPNEVSPSTMRRIAEIVCRRLSAMASGGEAGAEEASSNQILRNVALVLNGLDKEKRDALLDEIEGNDDEVAKLVKALMVTWEDITKIEDKSLQECLRKVDAGVLAKALFGADPDIIEKIRSNISERAGQMVDEETSLMSEPRKTEILEAREEVAKPLREANEADELVFIEDE